MLREEGLDQVFARHRRYGAATRAAVGAWGLELLCLNPEEYSPAVTAVVMPRRDDGSRHDADALRKIILERFNMSRVPDWAGWPDGCSASVTGRPQRPDPDGDAGGRADGA